MLKFCQWRLDQPKDFPQKVIWLDEKLWKEKVRPNNQNKRMWGLSDPEFEDENKLQGGKKVMCWGALMKGKVIVHWLT